jgi:chaperonin cofactor prefoldin
MVDAELLIEKDHSIGQLKETIEILELKVKKLEQLVKLKDSKIVNLSGKL